MHSLSYATKDVAISPTTNSVTGSTSYDIAGIGDKIENTGIQLYNTTILWYHKHNTKITVLPDLLRVPMIDCIAVLLGIFL